MRREKSYNRIIAGSLIAIFLCCVAIACKKSKPSTGEEVVDQEVTYEVSSEIFPNTERGFTKTIPVYSGGVPLNVVSLKTLRSQNISLVVRVIYFNLFKDKALDAATLKVLCVLRIPTI